MLIEFYKSNCSMWFFKANVARYYIIDSKLKVVWNITITSSFHACMKYARRIRPVASHSQLAEKGLEDWSAAHWFVYLSWLEHQCLYWHVKIQSILPLQSCVRIQLPHINLGALVGEWILRALHLYSVGTCIRESCTLCCGRDYVPLLTLLIRF